MVLTPLGFSNSKAKRVNAKTDRMLLYTEHVEIFISHALYNIFLVANIGCETIAIGHDLY